jgi:hypothetical protein
MDNKNKVKINKITIMIKMDSNNIKEKITIFKVNNN